GPLRGGAFADDDDFLAVDGDRWLADEPFVGQPAGKPGGDVVGGRKIGLLPTRPATEAPAAVAASMLVHRCSLGNVTYKITPRQKERKTFRRRRVLALLRRDTPRGPPESGQQNGREGIMNRVTS